MTPDVAARALEPFFSTKPFGKGSGLGLSMVHAFMSQVGGHVRIDTAPGRGTTVSLYLPRAAAVAPAGRDVRAPAPTGRETVLVVEDNELVRDMAARLLRSLGYVVLQTATGADAATLLEAGAAVDLLFTDVVMPGQCDGIGLAGRARALRPGLKVLLTSGHPIDGLSPEGRELAGVRSLAKPYALRDLATAVREALDS
jgi:CheY-like chemotaxis protein